MNEFQDPDPAQCVGCGRRVGLDLIAREAQARKDWELRYWNKEFEHRMAAKRSPQWHNVTKLLPGISDKELERSDEVLAVNRSGIMRVAFLQYGDESPRWKIAGRDFYDFEDVIEWSPLKQLRNG